MEISRDALRPLRVELHLRRGALRQVFDARRSVLDARLFVRDDCHPGTKKIHHRDTENTEAGTMVFNYLCILCASVVNYLLRRL